MNQTVPAEVILSFDLDAEEVWIGENPQAKELPVMLSQGGYEFKVAVPEILRILKVHGLLGTFFVPGRVAQKYANAIDLILADGHEIAHHGHTHRAPSGLSVNEEREELELGLETLSKFQVPILGYRAPSWSISTHTLDLVAEFGLKYSSNFMDDIRPYSHVNGLVELPVSWLLDDAAHFWFSDDDSWLRKIATNGEAHEIMSSEFQGITRLGGVSVFTFHGQLIGRPGRLPLLEQLISEVVEAPQVDIITCAEALDRFHERQSGQK